MTDTVRVPREPTEAMARAFRDARPDTAVETEDGGWAAPASDWFRAQYVAVLAASPQGEGSSADATPIKPSADTGELRERIVSVVKNAVRDFEDDINEDWKTAMTNAAGKAADAILDLIQSERAGSPIGQNDQPGLAFSGEGEKP